MKKQKLFVWDLANLVRSVHEDADAILEVTKIIIEALGPKAPHARIIVSLVAEIDRRRAHEINPATGKLLPTMERFPGSCVETYREICARIGVEPDLTTEGLLHDVGMTAFDESLYRRNVVPGAKKVLDFLAAQGDILVLLTTGDYTVQMRKVAALKARGIKHFTMIFIVERKIPKTFWDIRYRFPRPDELSPISVGNSMARDVLSAIGAEFFGIYIPVGTRERLDQPLPKIDDESQSIALNDIRQIIEIYEDLP